MILLPYPGKYHLDATVAMSICCLEMLPPVRKHLPTALRFTGRTLYMREKSRAEFLRSDTFGKASGLPDLLSGVEKMA